MCIYYYLKQRHKVLNIYAEQKTTQQTHNFYDHGTYLGIEFFFFMNLNGELHEIANLENMSIRLKHRTLI